MLACATLSTKAQQSPIDWLYVIDGYNDVYLADITVDSMGNTYAAINYTSNLSLPGLNKKLPYAGHVHGLIMKFNKQGKPLWAHPFKSAFDNRIRDISLAPNGSLLITGFGDGLLCFPGSKDTLKVGKARETPYQYNYHQGFYAASYSPEGERNWVKYFNTGWGEGLSIAANSRNEVFIAGYYGRNLKEGDKLIDTLSPKYYDYKISLVKLSAKGEFISTNPMGLETSPGYTTNVNVQIDKADNMYLYGNFRGRILLSPKDSLTNDAYYESIDAFIAKYDQGGQLQWGRKLGGQNTQVIKGLILADDSTVYVAGNYGYECTVGDNINIVQKSKFEYSSNTNSFYLHLLKNGDVDFIEYFEGRNYSGVNAIESIAIDRKGRAHIVGYFTDTLEMKQFSNHTKADNYTGVYSLWEADEVSDLSILSKNPKGWLFPRRIALGNGQLSVGGEYYGDSTQIISSKGFKAVPNKDYGAVVFIGGGFIDDQTGPLHTDTVHTIREARFAFVKNIEQCITATDSSAAEVWIKQDSIAHAAPCGTEVKGMSALLYPNPTQGIVNIKLNGIKGNVEIEIADMAGKFVFSRKIMDVTEGQVLSFDIKNLSSGSYIVRISQGKYQKGIKLIKN